MMTCPCHPRPLVLPSGLLIGREGSVPKTVSLGIDLLRNSQIGRIDPSRGLLRVLPLPIAPLVQSGATTRMREQITSGESVLRWDCRQRATTDNYPRVALHSHIYPGVELRWRAGSGMLMQACLLLTEC